MHSTYYMGSPQTRLYHQGWKLSATFHYNTSFVLSAYRQSLEKHKNIWSCSSYRRHSCIATNKRGQHRHASATKDGNSLQHFIGNTFLCSFRSSIAITKWGQHRHASTTKEGLSATFHWKHFPLFFLLIHCN